MLKNLIWSFMPLAATSPSLSFQTQNLLFFCKSFPLQPFFFFFRTDYIIPQTFTVTSSIGCFYFLVFLFYNF